MVKTTFLVPINDNEGNPFPRSHWQELEQRLLEFKGFSCVEGVRGAWIWEGKVYNDISHQYIVSLKSWAQLPAWLEVVRWTRETFKQETLYVEVAGVPEIMGAEVAVTKGAKDDPNEA